MWDVVFWVALVTGTGMLGGTAALAFIEGARWLLGDDVDLDGGA
jgi:hypothetical protein